MTLGSFDVADLYKGLVIYSLALRAHVLRCRTAPTHPDDIPAIKALVGSQKLKWHGVEPVPIPVDIDTGDTDCFAVGLPRFRSSFHDYANFNRVSPLAQGSVHGNMFDGRTNKV